MINIDGVIYYIDMDKLLDFVLSSNENERNCSQTIIQSYGYPRNQMGEFMTDEKFTLMSKEVSEAKQGIAETNQNIRYDMMKTFLSVLLDISQNDFASTGKETSDFTLEDLSFGQRLAFNTLYEKGIIVLKP